MEKKLRYITYASLAVIILTCGFLALPGQFILPVDYPTIDAISGYQFYFRLGGDVYNNLSGAAHLSGLGIATIVLMALALCSYVFAKKSSSLVLLGGLLNVACAICFFCMNASKASIYGARRNWFAVGWVAYVAGAFLILTGLLSIYFAIRSFMVEKKEMTQRRESYSYLKK